MLEDSVVYEAVRTGSTGWKSKGYGDISNVPLTRYAGIAASLASLEYWIVLTPHESVPFSDMIRRYKDHYYVLIDASSCFTRVIPIGISSTQIGLCGWEGMGCLSSMIQHWKARGKIQFRLLNLTRGYKMPDYLPCLRRLQNKKNRKKNVKDEEIEQSTNECSSFACSTAPWIPLRPSLAPSKNAPQS